MSINIYSIFEKEIINEADFCKRMNACQNALLKRKPIPFKYPEELRGENAKSKWTKNIENIKKLNEPLLSQLRSNANLYSIFIKDKNSTWKPVYIGHSKSKLIRQRISHHLINKSDETGSVLIKVMQAIAQGKEIGLQFLKIEPEYMRLVVEERLIFNMKKKLEWNNHG